MNRPHIIKSDILAQRGLEHELYKPKAYSVE